MKTLQFKTNINCGGCIAKVTPFLNEEKSIEKWSIDTTVPEKTLTIETQNNNTETIVALIQKAGFKIEEI